VTARARQPRSPSVRAGSQSQAGAGSLGRVAEAISTHRESDRHMHTHRSAIVGGGHESLHRKYIPPHVGFGMHSGWLVK